MPSVLSIKLAPARGLISGAVTSKALGFVPSLDLQYREATLQQPPAGTKLRLKGMGGSISVQQWLRELDVWVRNALDHYDGDPCFDAARSHRAGESLIAYQSTPATRGQTVVVSSYVKRGVVTPVDEDVVSVLNSNGIYRMICGHKPVGDSPYVTMVRDKLGGGLELIIADTSFSDPSSADNRGCAVAEVCLKTDCAAATGQACSQTLSQPLHGSVLIHGKLHDGEEYVIEPGDPHVGKVINGGFIIKAKLSRLPGNCVEKELAYYRASRTKDRENEYMNVSELEL